MDSVTFRAFSAHAAGGPEMPNDYVATKLAMLRMFPKLAMGLNSEHLLAQSIYHNNGANAVGLLAHINPLHRSGLLNGVKNIAPAVGGVRVAGTNPLRAVASGVLRSKLAGMRPALEGAVSRVGQNLKAHPFEHALELGGLGILARPSFQRLRGKPMSHKAEAGHELAGLGVLAAPSAYHLLMRH